MVYYNNTEYFYFLQNIIFDIINCVIGTIYIYL